GFPQGQARFPPGRRGDLPNAGAFVPSPGRAPCPGVRNGKVQCLGERGAQRKQPGTVWPRKPRNEKWLGNGPGPDARNWLARTAFVFGNWGRGTNLRREEVVPTLARNLAR